MDSEGTKLNTQWQNSVEQLLKRWGAQASGLRLALDNEEDFVFLNSIVRKMRKPHTEYSFKEMYELSKC